MSTVILDFVMQYWASIILVILVIGVLGFMWAKGYKKEVKKIIYDLVVIAEEQLGSGTGEIKRTRVKRWIYEQAPWIVKLFITYDTFDDIIEEAVEKLKKFLADGGDLLTYSENMELQARQYTVD